MTYDETQHHRDRASGKYAPKHNTAPKGTLTGQYPQGVSGAAKQHLESLRDMRAIATQWGLTRREQEALAWYAKDRPLPGSDDPAGVGRFIANALEPEVDRADTDLFFAQEAIAGVVPGTENETSMPFVFSGLHGDVVVCPVTTTRGSWRVAKGENEQWVQSVEDPKRVYDSLDKIPKTQRRLRETAIALWQQDEAVTRVLQAHSELDELLTRQQQFRERATG